MLSEKQIEELAEVLKHRFFSGAEIQEYVLEHYNYKSTTFLILSVLDARGYKCAQEERKSSHGMKPYYKIFTDEEYEKIEEKRRENVKRRLLASISG